MLPVLLRLRSTFDRGDLIDVAGRRGLELEVAVGAHLHVHGHGREVLRVVDDRSFSRIFRVFL